MHVGLRSYEKGKTKMNFLRYTFCFSPIKIKVSPPSFNRSLIQTSIMDIAMSNSNSDWTTVP